MYHYKLEQYYIIFILGILSFSICSSTSGVIFVCFSYTSVIFQNKMYIYPSDSSNAALLLLRLVLEAACPC